MSPALFQREQNKETYPDNIIWQPDNLIAGSLGHLRETLRLSLILKSVAGKIDSCDVEG